MNGIKEKGGLGYVPALDGLRAVAVGAVLLYHHDAALLPGGYLGVSLFFTLSGFLIASLLFAEQRRSGTISLRSFWARRVRRIVPVAWVGLALGVLATATIVSETQRSAVTGDVRAALVSLLNWRYVFADGTYADQVLDPSPVVHYWSLAIEEQFYVVLPLVVLVTRGRRLLLAGCALSVIGVSLVQQLRLEDVNRLYYGTDVRMGELAAGVLLAIVLPRIRPSAARSDLLGWSSAALLLGAFVLVRLSDPPLLSGGLTLVSALSVGVIIGAICGRSFRLALATPVAVSVGRCSFALYVVHLPVFVLLSPERTQLAGTWLLVVRLVVTGVVAGLLHILVEDPIRFRLLLIGRASVGVGFAGVTALLVFATTLIPSSEPEVGFTVTAPPPTASERAAIEPPPAGVDERAVAPGLDDPDSADGACAGAGCAESAAGPGRADESSGGAGDAREVSTVETRDPVELLVIGDSTAGVNGRAMASVGAELGTVRVTVANAPACAVLPGERLLVRKGFWFETPCRGDFAERVAGVVAEANPDVIVVFLGSAQVGLWDYGGPTVEGLDSQTVLLRYEEALRGTLAGLDQLGVPVLWADVPLPAWDLEAFGAETNTVPTGSGPVSLNDEVRWKLLDAADTAALSASRNVVRWGYVDSLEGPTGQLDHDLFFDGLHLRDEAAERLARESWLPSIASVYAGHPAANVDTVWSSLAVP